jgi:hypothetical protein
VIPGQRPGADREGATSHRGRLWRRLDIQVKVANAAPTTLEGIFRAVTTIARGPRVLKGALVSIDRDTSVPNVIPFQYNPATVKRTLKPVMGGGEGDRAQAVRLSGAPQETISIEIELDATDKLEKADATALSVGLHPQIADLELLAYPPTSRVMSNARLLNAGVIEISPILAPRLLFVWGAKRVQPVQITSYSISEEEFDVNLNPIRATISLELRVLTYSDVSTSNADYHQFLAYQQGLEGLAGSVSAQQSADRQAIARGGDDILSE